MIAALRATPSARLHRGVVSCQVVDDFRDGDANGWSPSGGTWQVENPFYGEYSGQDGTGTQVSLWDQSMTSGRLGATVIAQVGPELPYNGYLVFDYLDASNNKYAGMDGAGQRWVIGEVIGGTDTLRAGVAGTIGGLSRSGEERLPRSGRPSSCR